MTQPVRCTAFLCAGGISRCGEQSSYAHRSLAWYLIPDGERPLLNAREEACTHLLHDDMTTSDSGKRSGEGELVCRSCAAAMLNRSIFVSVVE